MEAQMKYKMNAKSLKAVCFRNRVYTMIPTSVKSKLFTSEVPTSQTSQSEDSLSNRSKTINSMLVLIPVIIEKS